MSNHEYAYCQWQNTALALSQVADDYEARLRGEASEPLSREERVALTYCFRTMQDLLEAAEIDDDTQDAGEQAVAMLTDAGDA
jgi:hypothetical protein